MTLASALLMAAHLDLAARSSAMRIKCLAIVLALAAIGPVPAGDVVEIGTTPQLMLDYGIIDNTWTTRYKQEHINRVFQQPQKHPLNPLIKGGAGYACVTRDEAGVFHLWYQSSVPGKDGRFDSAIAYAHSQDGIDWTLPNLGLHERNGSKDNNIVLRGRHSKASSPFLLDVPTEFKRGYRYLLSYKDADGTHLVGSNDGPHFDPHSDQLIQKLHSDTQNSIVYDAARQQFVMYCRAKAVYRAAEGDILEIGESRRIARVVSKDLWAEWPRDAENILLPDELDTQQRYHAFYGMPTTAYGGMFLGFLWPFRWNDRIHTELAWSRDGIHFERHPLRPRLVDYGPADAWDDEMVFASSWVEAGDEWRIYYGGWDGPHGTTERNGGLGLATIRREGFVSLHGPRNGGVICTRPLKWPGGKLLVNADAKQGELTVRVSSRERKPIPGFDYADCRPFDGDSTATEIAWKHRSINDLAGESIRLEFFVKNADLYSFRAIGP